MLRNYVSAVLILAASFFFTVFLSGGGLIYYLLDLPSMIIMVVVPFLYQWFLFGSSMVCLAFTAGFRKETSMEQIAKAQLFFKSYSKVTWISAFMAVLLGAVAILAHIEDPQLLGPNFAVALLSLLYGVLIHYIIIIPNSVFLKKRLIELGMEL
jgi:hypothetical protein